MNVLVDTNVIIDWLLFRPKNAEIVLSTSEFLDLVGE